jgi:Mor family transcriptional regulator
MPKARFLTYSDRAIRREKVVTDYRFGREIPDLAEQYGLSRNRVRTILRDAGFRRRRQMAG